MTISRKQKQLFFMIQRQIPKPYSLSPGEKLPDDVINAFQNANAQYKKSRDFTKYTKTLQSILGLPDFVPFTEEEKLFFGGFIEGEGSISVSAKKTKFSRFGVYFDPEFSLTQHVNGSIHLFRSLCHFRAGLIKYKSKSNATLVYTVDARQTLKEKIVPFFKKYVTPYSCIPKQKKFEKWCTLLDLFDQEAHQDFKRFVYEIGPIWDQLRMQKGQSNETFSSFEDFEEYVLTYVQEKAKGGK
jgi:hypothetical protein